MNIKTLYPALIIAAVISASVLLLSTLSTRAGSLEPPAAPEPTMVTLEQLSNQIQSLSHPVRFVVKGVVTVPEEQTSSSASLSAASPNDVTIEPNSCSVLLSDAVATQHSGTANPEEWLTRNGAYLISLTKSQITVGVEIVPVPQKVGYQIIQYK